MDPEAPGFTMLGMRNTPGYGSVLQTINPSSGEAFTIATLNSFVELDSGGAWFAADLIAIDRSNQIVYILKSNNFEGYPTRLVGVSYANGDILTELTINSSFPISGLHFDYNDGSLVAFGLQMNADGTWHYIVGRLDTVSSPDVFKQQISVAADVAPYVDYAWSDYDSGASVLYVFSRHEDEPS